MPDMTKTELPGQAQSPQWDLCLYVADQTPKCTTAATNLKRICEKHLCGRYHIEVVDVYEHPERAVSDQILAIPTVVRRSPRPVRTTIGNLSNTQRVLEALDFSDG